MYFNKRNDIKLDTCSLLASHFVGRLLEINNKYRPTMVEVMKDQWLEQESETMANVQMDEDSEDDLE